MARSESIYLRCDKQFKTILDQLSKQVGHYYYGKSQADILHDLVEDAGKKMLQGTIYWAILRDEPIPQTKTNNTIATRKKR